MPESVSHPNKARWTGPLVAPAAAFALGVWIQERLSAPLGATACAALLCFCVGAPRLRTPRARLALAAVWLGWLCLGMSRMAIGQSGVEARSFAGLTEEAAPVRIHGVVASAPDRVERPDQSPAWSMTVNVSDVAQPELWRPRGGKLWTLLPDRSRLEYGDEVLLEGRWSLPPAATNPGQYDWRAALLRDGISGVLRVSDPAAVVTIGKGRGNPFVGGALRLRARWQRQLRRALPPRAARLFCAMLLGERGQLDERTRREFVETGTLHLLVVSGFNVGIVAVLVLILLRVSGICWSVRWVLAAVAVAGYGVVTGWDPPVARAALMTAMVLGSKILDRAARWDNLLAAGALVLLAIRPAQLMDPGFQLSFGAVASLLAMGDLLAQFQAGDPKDKRLSRPVRWLALIAAATAAVWVGLWPLLAWYFHRVAPVSVLANIVLVPLASAAVWIGMPLLLGTLVWPPLLASCSGLLSGLADLILSSVQACHRIPGGSWVVGSPPIGPVMGYYGLLGLTLFGLRRRWRAQRLLLLWLAAAVAAQSWALAENLLRRRRLRMDVLDVGHGDAQVLRLPGGQVVVFDAGTEQAGRRVVVPFLLHEGIQRIDALILSHPDSDHIGGAIPILEELKVLRLLTNGSADDTMAFLRLGRLARELGVPHAVLRAGGVLEPGSGVVIEAVHPPEGFVPGTDPASNDNAIVLRVAMGRSVWLLTADLEEAGVPFMLSAKSDWRAQILKVPHHGSRLGAAGARLFGAVRPELALISVGRLHHLPAAETLQALKSSAAETLLTRDEGCISVETDGTVTRVRSRRVKGHRLLSPAQTGEDQGL